MKLKRMIDFKLLAVILAAMAIWSLMTPANVLAKEGAACGTLISSACNEEFGEFCSNAKVCRCRYGTFEIGLPLTGGYAQGASICEFVAQFAKPDSPGGALGVLVELIVRMLMALVVMAAMVMMAAGGYVYMTAGGNGDKVRLAKNLIGSALLGIFLALAAYAILNFINPSTTP